MKLTYNWLKEYIALDLPVTEVGDGLTMRGLEVAGITSRADACIRSVQVVRVLTVEPHPTGERLAVCKVSHGRGEVQVVCGAPNVRVGMLSAWAPPGTKLGNDSTVEAQQIRGKQSEGMLCSERELGLSDDHSGVMDLPGDLLVGQALVDALGLDDFVIEVDLTPNRADCASVIGIAREVAGLVGGALKHPLPPPQKYTGKAPFRIDIMAPEACSRYAARLLTDVTVAPSPLWLRNRLRAVGVRPINNVVDITNFVMMEYGQPLHAFDFDTLAEGRIVVRMAREGEKIVTLDGVERSADPDMLLICDPEKPVAIAGVMGGENTEVTEGTKQVLLESAHFNPVSIRKTARQLRIASEAAYRFERGVDPEGVLRALERAVQLMQEITGATAVEDGLDCYPRPYVAPVLPLRVGRTNDVLGTKLSAQEMRAVLEGIEIVVSPAGEAVFSVTPPSFRVDLTREVDLIEEVARLVGYNDIPATLPTVPMSFAEKDPGRDLRKKVASVLTGLGFFEAINYSFSASRYFDMLRLTAEDPLRSVVRLRNPLSDDQDVMRSTLLPGLLENLRRNVSRQNTCVRLFEVGKVFWSTGSAPQPIEKLRCAGIMSGARIAKTQAMHFPGNQDADFYDVKGAVEVLGKELYVADISFVPYTGQLSYALPGSVVSVRSGAQEIGLLAAFAPAVLRDSGVKQEAWFFDLDLDAVLGAGRKAIQFAPLPKFPSVNWDVAVVVKDGVPAGDMLTTILASGEPFVESAEIFDVYRGKPIPAGHKSVAMSVTYRSNAQTLEEATVGEVHRRIVELVLSRFHGQLREGD